MISVQIDAEFEPLVDAPRLAAMAKITLKHQGLAEHQDLAGDGDRSTSLTIVLTDDEAVRELNLAFRALDAPTDVLSFPNQDFSPPALTNQSDPSDSPASFEESEPNHTPETLISPELILPEEIAAEDAAYLGDIIIAVPYTQRQAARVQKTLTDELDLLVVHGVLHLLGYDHGTVEEEAVMWRIQDEILEASGDTIR